MPRVRQRARANPGELDLELHQSKIQLEDRLTIAERGPAADNKLFIYYPEYNNVKKNLDYPIHPRALYEHSKYIEPIVEEQLIVDPANEEFYNIEHANNLDNWTIFMGVTSLYEEGWGSYFMFINDEGHIDNIAIKREDIGKFLFYKNIDVFGILAPDKVEAEKIIDKYPLDISR